MTSYGDHVPSPSVALVHVSGRRLSNAARLSGVRSRMASASWRLKLNVLHASYSTYYMASLLRRAPLQQNTPNHSHPGFYPHDLLDTTDLWKMRTKTPLFPVRGLARLKRAPFLPAPPILFGSISALYRKDKRRAEFSDLSRVITK
jgi:hypothetical protein